MCLTGRLLAAGVFLLLAACAGGAPPPQTAPAPQTTRPPAPVGTAGVQTGGLPQPAAATGSIAGIVRAAEAGAPLARARVTLTSPALAEPRVAITGDDGRFIFTRLPAGSYTVAVTRSGYVPQQFGERRSAPPAIVPLADGRQLTGLDIAMARAGVIVGQILDEDGSPFVGARVDALVSRTENNQPTLASVASAVTDDRGNFRISGLAAGAYYVSAVDPAFERVGDDAGPLSYSPTFYPGVVLAEQAQRVTVTPGAEPAERVVFTLQIIRPARVSGRIAAMDGRQLISGAVIMSPVGGDALAAIATRDVMILPDGRFAFRNVPPGRYQIRARGETEPGGTSLFATFTVTVAGQDVGNLMLTLSPGASVGGTVIVDAAAPVRPTFFDSLRVRAPLADGSSFGDALTGDVRPDGEFRIRGLMTGTHFLVVEGLQYPWTVKSVLHRGQEIADTGIEVESRQEIRDVRIVVTDTAAEVSGLVRDARGQAAADALVLIIPVAQQFWTRTSRRFGLVRANAEGRYRVRGLPPGEYHGIATYDITEGEAYRREILREVIPYAVAVTIRDRQQHVVDLPLMTISAPSRTVSR